jgi:hypothetical protein
VIPVQTFFGIEGDLKADGHCLLAIERRRNLTSNSLVENFDKVTISGGEQIGWNREDTSTRYLHVPIFVLHI